MRGTVIEDTIYIDYTELSQMGVNGEAQVYYTEKFVNGVSCDKTVTETKVIPYGTKMYIKSADGSVV